MKVFHINHPNTELFHNNKPHVMALGFFDGVHLGHQALLRHAKLIAAQKKMAFSVMTFSPHPDEVIKGDKGRKYLTPLENKLEKLALFGVDQVFVIKFDRDFASLPPIDFVNEYIIDFNVKHAVVGFDFTFGFKAEGDTELLRKLSGDGIFGVTIVPKKTYNNEKISSTLLRKTLIDGEVDLIPYYLGSHYEVRATVDEDGQANFNEDRNLKVIISKKILLPKPGAYHVEVTDGKETLKAEFKRFFEEGKACEITFMANRSFNRKKEFKVKFLNRIPSLEALSV